MIDLKHLFRSSLMATLILSAPVYAQVSSGKFDDLAKSVVTQIDKIENDIAFKVNKSAICFPEYSKALKDFLKTVKKSSETFKLGINTDKVALEKFISVELVEYEAVKKLAKSNPDNQGYQNLLKDKTERFTAVLNQSLASFSSAYKSKVKQLVYTFPFQNIPVGRTKRNDGKGMVYDYVITHLDMSKEIGIASEHYWGNSTQDFPMKLSDYLTSGGYVDMDVERPWGDDYDNFYEIREWNALMVEAREKASAVFKKCKTAGCTFQLSEYLKAWLVSMGEIDLSLEITKDPINLRVEAKGFINSPANVKLAIDGLAAHVAKSQPIGKLTPACTQEEMDDNSAKGNL